MSAVSPARRSYSFADYLGRKSLIMLALGFSSGIPFLLVANTFAFWLRDEGITLTAIGFLSWVGIPYSLQFVWAPLLDRAPMLKFLGQRRGWLLVSQILVAIGLAAMALAGVGHGLVLLTGLALLVAISAATQDIAISAWRIEIADDADEMGLLTAGYTFGYRIAVLCTDALALVMAQHLGWTAAYLICASGMGIGIIATLLAAEPRRAEQVIDAKEKELPLWTPAGFSDAIVGPFIVFFRTYGLLAITMLAAIAFYRVPDFVRGPMVNPFFHDIGMSKDMVGLSRATFGIGSILVGVAAGGYCSLRFGLMRSLLLGGLLQGLGIAANGLLIVTKTAFAPFVAVMMLDDFSLSFAAICLVTYMSSLTSLGYTATQYALLSSAYALVGKFFKGFSGLVIDGLAAQVGRMDAYALFFVGCGLMGLPSLALFAWLAGKTAKKPGV